MSFVSEYLPGIFQHIGDLIFLTDLEGKILDCNITGKMLLGYSRDEVLHRPLTDFWMNGKECHETLAWVVSDAGLYVSNLEARFRKKSGDEVDLSLTLSKHKNGNGSILGIVGVGRDITEKKKVEAALRSTYQELENFIYTISHDLKSPVLSIEGYTSMLIRDYQEVLDEKGRHYLERVQWNAHKMGLLLRDLLELSRSGRVIGKLRDVDMGETLSVLLEEMAPQIKQGSIEVVVADNLPRLWCDRDRLAQVFENLLSNAIKFMGDQPNPRIEVGYNDLECYHEFFVRDNGIGIDPQYHEKIFGIFQRLEEIHVEGTGVGLTIAKRIIENHGGTIRVVSGHGQGAAFYFTIPKRLRGDSKHAK